LLDLSLRNRLLNFRETKSTIRILSPSPERVEDELAAERELSLHPGPRLLGEDDPRSEITYTQQQRADALADHLRDELSHGRLHTNLDNHEHVRRLTELFRSARNSLEENGTNTLFAAVGLLEWKETEHSDRVFRAPLLLIPVELKRKSVLEGFSLRRIDEETRLNVTLIEMLRQHFHKEIPGLDPLPEDESGVDVRRVFRIFREAVRDLPGWEVKTEIWLGQFSFTKFLLWKDLSDRLDALTQNRIVNHLVNHAGTPYPNPPEDIHPSDLDDRFHPREVYCPRSADSSQLAAVMAAAAGHDFVLEGPPGTGKSQTIANIIAHCLAHGKRVLFVAEKRAALDVVYRRLREEGLEPFCLELHSNKTGKADVIAQFDHSLKFLAEAGDIDWEQRANALERLRRSLNDYARTLHRRLPCGLSACACFDYLLPRRAEPTVNLDQWPAILDTSATRLEEARELCRRLQERARAVMPLHDHPLTPVACEEWSPTWQERAPALADALRECAATAAVAASELLAWLRRPQSALSRTQLTDLLALVDCLLAPQAVGPAFASTPWSQLATDLDHWLALIRERAALRKRLTDYGEAKLLALQLDALKAKWTSAQSAWFLVKWLHTRSIQRTLRTTRKNASAPAAVDLESTLNDALRLRALNAELSSISASAENVLGSLWAKGEPSEEALMHARAWGESLHRALVACAGEDLVWLGQLRQLLATLFAEGPSMYAAGTPIGARLVRYRDALSAFNGALDAFASEVKLRREAVDDAPDHLGAVQALTERLKVSWKHVREWCYWQKARRAAVEAGLSPVIARLESVEGTNLDVPALFERSFRKALLFAIIEREPALKGFFGSEHNERIERFRELDDALARLSREIIRTRLAARIPRDQAQDDVPKTEIGLLRREIAKKTRHIPVRQLLSRIPHLLPRLKPCVLMSPPSVAQYLEPSHEMFDVVIFDEASQIPVWDAIGAIARGKQLIVVGDPKQLPPTNFFNTTGNDDDADLAPEEFEDLESILDELMTHGLRHKRLQWHYRSRHEGLIAFSNRQYYENDLLTFPSPETALGGVRFRYLPEARYDKGKSRTNRLEAKALVKELVSRLRNPDTARYSYGVVTFSLAQQQLVENLLDEERRKHPEIEVHFGDEPPVEGEPVFVKNLENVQGDERDVIFFSICYGLDETGRISMNFGPLNRDGGERRLNVAITRAKQEVVVFSGIKADHIDLTRTRAKGVRDLKHFLDYAERGPKALIAAATAGDGEPDSEFERMVADRLRQAGFDVHHQVGCSGYRIDLAVLDPSMPHRYLLGIECDGATYHRAATARDRDKLRQLILEGLGWKLYRIWSTDWWHDSEKEMQKLLQFIHLLSRGDRI